MKYFNRWYQWIWVILLIITFIYFGTQAIDCSKHISEKQINSYCERNFCGEGANAINPMKLCQSQYAELFYGLFFISIAFNLLYVIFYYIKERKNY